MSSAIEPRVLSAVLRMTHGPRRAARRSKAVVDSNAGSRVVTQGGAHSDAASVVERDKSTIEGGIEVRAEKETVVDVEALSVSLEVRELERTVGAVLPEDALAEPVVVVLALLEELTAQHALRRFRRRNRGTRSMCDRTSSGQPNRRYASGLTFGNDARPKGANVARVPMRAGLTATLQIRWARQDARLSQKELVQLAGVSHQQIAKLEELVVARLTTHPLWD
jgi:hypothetical protein